MEPLHRACALKILVYEALSGARKITEMLLQTGVLTHKIGVFVCTVGRGRFLIDFRVSGSLQKSLSTQPLNLFLTLAPRSQ